MKRVLIAEDEQLLAELYKTNLESEDFAVDVVFDGKAAIDKMKKRSPDLLLLDLLMPGTDGFAVLEWLHEKHKKKKSKN